MCLVPEGEIVVSTTRVETMLGDTAVAVHPLDARYKSVIGEHVWHPFREERVPIICDDFVNPDLGTGEYTQYLFDDFR
jgi:valyl-tRNA synthetase